jgi:hypothetical protein
VKRRGLLPLKMEPLDCFRSGASGTRHETTGYRRSALLRRVRWVEFLLSRCSSFRLELGSGFLFVMCMIENHMACLYRSYW